MSCRILESHRHEMIVPTEKTCIYLIILSSNLVVVTCVNKHNMVKRLRDESCPRERERERETTWFLLSVRSLRALKVRKSDLPTFETPKAPLFSALGPPGSAVGPVGLTQARLVWDGHVGLPPQTDPPEAPPLAVSAVRHGSPRRVILRSMLHAGPTRSGPSAPFGLVDSWCSHGRGSPLT